MTRFGHRNLKKRPTLFAKFLADDFYGENWTNAIAWADEHAHWGGYLGRNCTGLLTEYYM